MAAPPAGKTRRNLRAEISTGGEQGTSAALLICQSREPASFDELLRSAFPRVDMSDVAFDALADAWSLYRQATEIGSLPTVEA